MNNALGRYPPLNCTMSKFHRILLYLSSLFPRRFLHFVLSLFKRISRRLGLSDSSDPPDKPSRIQPRQGLDTGSFTAGSYVPTAGPSCEYVPLGNIVLSQAFSAGNHLELDTSDVSLRMSQSPVQSPTSPFSATLVCSPRSTRTSTRTSTYPKPEGMRISLTPTTPSKTSRYDGRTPAERQDVGIPAGPPAVHRGRQRSLPDGWLAYTHPEGLTYFVDGSRNIKVVTEAYIYDHDIRRILTDFADSVFTYAASDGWHLTPSSTELLVEYDEEKDSCSYYFVDDADQVIFWLDEIDAEHLEDLDIEKGSGHDHLRTQLHQLFWQHTEYFPVHRRLPDHSEQNLVATLTHNCIDVVTSQTSTSAYERSQLETMLSVMKNLKHSAGSEGQRNCIIARLWTEIYRTRFINLHGEKSARLFRTQYQREKESSSFFLKLIFFLLFDSPSTQLATLKDIYAPDEVLYGEQWRKFVSDLIDDWQDLIIWTTVLLAANMSFLAIFNSKEDVVAETRAVTCSVISTLCSTVSIVIGLLHVRKHRPQKHARDASEGMEYLQAALHPKFGFQPLAIIYSLPYALLMWAMATFIAAILVYTFNSGLPHISTYVVSAIAIVLGCTLVWVTYRLRTQDEPGLLGDLRKLGGSLRWPSSLKLNRTVKRRSCEPGVADGPISMRRNWMRKSSTVDSVSPRGSETPQSV